MTVPNVPDTYRDQLAAIRAPDFCEGIKYREQQWRAERKGADPRILTFERLLVRRMRNLNIPMFASEVMRSQQRQLLLWTEGHSRVKEYGPHTRGAAVDIIHGIHGWNIPKKAWSLVGHIGKEIIAQESLGMRWGGDWDFYDPAHWELTDWKNHPPF